MNAVRRFVALSSEGKRLHLEVWRAVWVARGRLWIARRSGVQKLIAPVPDEGDDTPTAGRNALAGAAVLEVARAVEAVSGFVPNATCLVKAIALRMLLARRACPAVVRFGVARQGASIGAHAWIEVPGVGEFGRESEHLDFAPLEAAPRGAASRPSLVEAG